MDWSRGIRQMQTLRKLPQTRPIQKINALIMTVSSEIPGNLYAQIGRLIQLAGVLSDQSFS